MPSPLDRGKVAGLVSGAAGVLLVSHAGPVVPDAAFAIAVVASLGAVLCYALAGVWIKRRARALPPIAMAGWSQLLGGVALLPIAVTAPVHGAITPTIVVNVLLLALGLQRSRLRALFPADCRRRPDARDDGDVPDAGVRHAVGLAVPG